MVDYSKWDRMDYGDSSGSDDGGGDDVSPRVTSLDEPGKVTIGPDGSLAIGTSSAPKPPRDKPLEKASRPTDAAGIPTVSGGVSGDAIDISDMKDESNEVDGNQMQSRAQQRRAQRTRNGGTHHCIITINGQELQLPIYWSQDRYTVTLRLGFPSAHFPPRSIRVRVDGALKYADRHSAVGSGIMGGHKPESGDDASYGSLEIVSVSREDKKETILLSEKLPRPIHLNQDEDEVDYEIEDHLDGAGSSDEGGSDECTKIVSITLPKAVPMAGMTLWWECPLVGYPPIDVAAIQDRNPSGKGKCGKEGAGKSSEEKKEAFQKAWEEAHVMFREKMKTREKQEIEIDD